MSKIIRNPEKASKEIYDLIIIGGGIYGVMLSYEATRSGLRTLLLERDDFGQHTSFNSLRIIHGGLRYLQTFDFNRFRESVTERRWFLKTFPHFVKPMPCLMPLYGNGLRRPNILRGALLANELLSYDRNIGIRKSHHIKRGYIVGVDQTRRIFPFVNPDGIKGGAVWYDALMTNPQRILIDLIRWSCKNGATFLNYTEACGLLSKDKTVIGVSAVDREQRQDCEFRSKVVINSAGPWSRQVAMTFHKDEPDLFKPSNAWNVLLDKKPLSRFALAVSDNKTKGQTYFLVPTNGKILAGTVHSPSHSRSGHELPSESNIRRFLNEINQAVPKLEASFSDIIHIFAGVLPVKEIGSDNLSVREVILDHYKRGGPYGMYSVSGVKFTTSRLVAQKTLNLIFKDRRRGPNNKIKQKDTIETDKEIYTLFDSYISNDRIICKDAITKILDEESVLHLDDLIFRRIYLVDDFERLKKYIPLFLNLFNWDEKRKEKEISRLKL